MQKKQVNFSEMEKHIIQFNDGSNETLYYDDPPHKYYWKEKHRPSVTQMTSTLSPIEPLIQWSSNEAANKFAELIKVGESYDEIQLDEFYKQIKFAHKKSLEKSGTIGSYVHKGIEIYIRDKIEPNFTNEEMIASFNVFKDWYRTQNGLELVWTEKKVLSREYGFTGTLDALFKNDKDEYMIFDWKTSKSIKLPYLAQIFMYYLCLKEMTNYKIVKGVIINCTKEGKLNIKTFDLNDESLEIAKSCIKLFYFTNPKFNYKQGEK